MLPIVGLPKAEQGVFGFGGEDVQTEPLGDLLAHPDALLSLGESHYG